MKIGRGVSELWRVENRPLPLTWPMAYTTACTTVQAVMVVSDLRYIIRICQMPKRKPERYKKASLAAETSITSWRQTKAGNRHIMDEQIQKKRNYEKRNTGKKSRITATTVIAEVLTTFDKLQISVVYIATFVQMPGNEHNKRQFNI